MTDLDGAFGPQAAKINQANRDAHAGNTHEAVTQQYLDDWSVESQLKLAEESIDWEAHKRFMRGL